MDFLFHSPPPIQTLHVNFLGNFHLLWWTSIYNICNFIRWKFKSFSCAKSKFHTRKCRNELLTLWKILSLYIRPWHFELHIWARISQRCVWCNWHSKWWPRGRWVISNLKYVWHITYWKTVDVLLVTSQPPRPSSPSIGLPLLDIYYQLYSKGKKGLKTMAKRRHTLVNDFSRVKFVKDTQYIILVLD